MEHINAEYDIEITNMSITHHHIYAIVHIDGKIVTVPKSGFVAVDKETYCIGEEHGVNFKFKTTNWSENGVVGNAAKKLGNVVIEVGLVKRLWNTNNRGFQESTSVDEVEQTEIKEDAGLSKVQTEFTRAPGNYCSDSGYRKGCYRLLSQAEWNRLQVVPKARAKFIYGTEHLIKMMILGPTKATAAEPCDVSGVAAVANGDTCIHVAAPPTFIETIDLTIDEDNELDDQHVSLQEKSYEGEMGISKPSNGRPAKKTKFSKKAPSTAPKTLFTNWLLENDIKQSAVDILVHEEIEDVDTFVRCTESHLEQIGIKLGARIKLLDLITDPNL